ncbi:MAG: FRG domain-containing protein [Bacteroidales bacterium]|nr:FRG domain-containing protein [Bacteroidales bacterium]
MENDNHVIEIKSLEQYIKEVKKICLPEQKTAFPKVYFRGEANKEWKTEASLFRGKLEDASSFEEDNSYYKNVNYTKESDLIASALIHCPQAFEKCPNAISRLIFMQHYGLPTRLYDVTANPLVALYFACNIELEINGKVLFTKSENNLWSSQYVNTLAEINEEFENDNKPITFWGILSYGKKKGVVPFGMEDAFSIKLFRNVTQSFLFQPSLDNERIRRQQGAMIFSSLLVTPNKKRYDELVKRKDYTIDDRKNIDQFLFRKGDINLRHMFEKTEFCIKYQYKENILNELNMVGINEAFLFPELEYQFQTIKSQNVPQSDWIEIK